MAPVRRDFVVRTSMPDSAYSSTRRLPGALRMSSAMRPPPVRGSVGYTHATSRSDTESPSTCTA
jgi:hypothetical protein